MSHPRPQTRSFPWDLGVVDWFDPEKGYGVAVSPGVGEVFLHVTNFASRPLTPAPSMPLAFEVARERGKTTGKNVRRLSGIDDLRALVLLYGTLESVSVKRRVRNTTRGRSFARDERFRYDVVAVALREVLEGTDPADARGVLESRASSADSWDDPESFERFFRLVAQQVDTDVADARPVPEYRRHLIATALDAAPPHLTFDAWQAARAQDGLDEVSLTVEEVEAAIYDNLFSLSDGEPLEPEPAFEISQTVLETHFDRLSTDDFEYVGRMVDGTERLQRLLALVDREAGSTYTETDEPLVLGLLRTSSDVHNAERHDAFCRKVLSSTDEPLRLALLAPSPRTKAESKPPPPLSAPAYADTAANLARSLLEAQRTDDYVRVLREARARMDPPTYRDFVDRAHKGIGGDVLLGLWRSHRHFSPGDAFLDAHEADLTPDEVRTAPADWRRRYYERRVARHVASGSLADLAMLAGYCHEDQDLVLGMALAQIESDVQRAALWLAFQRAAQFGGGRLSAPVPTGALRDALADPARFEAFRRAYRAATYEPSWAFLSPDPRPFGDAADRKSAARFASGDPDEAPSDLLRAGLAALGADRAAAVLLALLTQTDDYGLTFDAARLLLERSDLSESRQRSVYDQAYDALSGPEQIDLWIDGWTDRTNLRILTVAFGTLHPFQQRRFLRRLFALSDRGALPLSVGVLKDIVEEGGDGVDLNVQVAVRVLESLSAEGRYLGPGALSDLVADFVGDRVEGVVQINDLIDRCPGRAVVRSDSDHYGKPRDQWYLVIDGEQFPVVDDEVVLDEDRSYPFDKEAKTVEIDGHTYRFRWKKVEGKTGDGYHLSQEEVPAGITFCEGRKAEKPDNWSGREFWWCCNKPCFAPAQYRHHHFYWESFTLRDFIRILGLPFDSEGYDRFAAMLNRTNRLLERLNCTSCGHLLRPAKSSGFAFYRVTTFHCTNEDCAERGNGVYLTHCLDWRCNGIVDSRVSAQCPNGWYICETCNGCCSHEKLSRRLDHLKTVGAFNRSNWKHRQLAEQVERRLGHAERGITFDHKTGNQTGNEG